MAPPATAVSPAKLRRIALDAQGLLRQAPFGRGREATRQAIERLGYVQIDTISVVARAHHHVLRSRVPTYTPRHLDALQRAGAVFEYWYHAAAYLPMRDYRFALRRMESMRRGDAAWVRCRDQGLMARVLKRIEAEGPLRSRDFEAGKSGPSGWWNWKPTKRALEQLFMQGDLMVIRREGFQKTYDLRERALPDTVDTRMPDDAAMARYLLDTMIRAHGFVGLPPVTHLRRGRAIRAAVKADVAARVADGALVPIHQPDGTVAYAASERLQARAPRATGLARLLSPFDNLVIHRDRVRSVFGFDYQLECYRKEADRVHGYFALPLLYRDQLVGRADCKAHRADERFEVRHLHLEDVAEAPEDLYPAIADAIRRFAAFHAIETIAVRRTSPRRHRVPLVRALAS